jgi:glutaredoxin
MNRILNRRNLTRITRCAAACGVVASLGLGALAQAQVYRIVGPDGKVTFSDQPPPASAKGAATVRSGDSGESASAASARLPFELRKVVGQYPVVLYTGKDCAPCSSGRNLLINRGIPFTEKTVDNNESASALRQLSGQSSIPLLTIGSQQLKGYSDATWSQYLTAAGYPEKSSLPAGYRNAPPSPLAVAKETAAAPNAAKPAAAPANAAAPEPEVPVVSPNSGIRF